MTEYQSQYAGFFRKMRAEVDEFHATGRVGRATQLSAATGHAFSDRRYPQYFFGDLDAGIVMIHRHPAASASEQERFVSFEAYFSHFRRFGARMYGTGATRSHGSRFDAKQVQFLREFGGIDFMDADAPESKYTNLERAIDHKLQLQLIPYETQPFRASVFANNDLLTPYFETIMDVIAVRPRTHVLFCGAAFESVVDRFVTKEHSFHLTKNDGTTEKARSSFANLVIEHKGEGIKAGWCRSWARQGIPMTPYAREVAARY